MFSGLNNTESQKYDEETVCSVKYKPLEDGQVGKETKKHIVCTRTFSDHGKPYIVRTTTDIVKKVAVEVAYAHTPQTPISLDKLDPELLVLLSGDSRPPSPGNPSELMIIAGICRHQAVHDDRAEAAATAGSSTINTGAHTTPADAPKPARLSNSLSLGPVIIIDDSDSEDDTE